MNRELRVVPEGVVVTTTHKKFFGSDVVKESYFKPLPKLHYQNHFQGINLVWVDNATGAEVNQKDELYVLMSNLWAMEGHNIKLGKNA